VPIRRGRFLGSEDFGKEMLVGIEERRDPNLYGVECLERAEEKAERLLAQGLKKLRWSEEDLTARRKCDAGKVKLAIADQAGDDDDIEVDCRPAQDGDMDESVERSVARTQFPGHLMSICGTPFRPLSRWRERLDVILLKTRVSATSNVLFSNLAHFLTAKGCPLEVATRAVEHLELAAQGMIDDSRGSTERCAVAEK
jgi:hypothetical protein